MRATFRANILDAAGMTPRTLVFAETAVALGVGTMGGAVFAWWLLPLPWLLGSMVVTFLVSLTTSHIALDIRLRDLAKPVMGVLVGSAFVPELFDDIARWPFGLATVFVYTLVSIACGIVFFRKAVGFDTATAIYAAPPGGLAEMLSASWDTGADARKLVLSHSIRIAFVVFTVPLIFRLVFGVETGGVRPAPPGSAEGLASLDWLVLGVCAVAAHFLGPPLRLPGGSFFAALLLSAAVHLTGITHASPPFWLIAAAQVLLGAGVGVRFRGLTRNEMATIGGWVLLWSSFLVALALGFAAAAAWWTSGDIRAYFLALAPGGFSEMMLITFIIGVETAFVATCHSLRLITLVAIVPAIQKFGGSGGRDGRAKGD